MMRHLLGMTAFSFAAGVAGEAIAGGFDNGLRIEAEAGAVWQSRNDARSPATARDGLPQGTRFSLHDLQGSGPAPHLRLSAAYTWSEKHQVYGLYAPLTINGTGAFDSPISFQGTTFVAGTPTRGRYRFDSYRIGYRYRLFDDTAWQVWAGVTLKIRDANIALSQGPLAANRANTGPVPLLNLYATRKLSDRWRAILDVEGLAAPQGRAIDVALKVRYQLNDGVGLSAGYRMLEGGADNDKVYTFAWLHYGVLAFDYAF
ncbi:MAG: hypothetical protein RLN70_13385 [Rhodospirillaceae bacterium]